MECGGEVDLIRLGWSLYIEVKNLLFIVEKKKTFYCLFVAAMIQSTPG